MIGPPLISQYRQKQRDDALRKISEGLATLTSEYRIDRIGDPETVKVLHDALKSLTHLKSRILPETKKLGVKSN